jgi:cardiolipin synthase A/B
MLMDTWQIISPFIIPIYYVAILAITANMLLENRNPLKTHSYFLLMLLLPGIGIIIYLFFGQQFRKRKIFSKKKLIHSAFGQEYVDKFLNPEFKASIPKDPEVVNFDKLTTFLSHDLSPLSSNNTVQILKNGEEKFPLLIQALREAKSHIHIEYYIYSDDDIGKQVSEILIEKAQSGVEVRLMVDGVGSFKLKRKFFRKLRAAGIQVHVFMPVLFPLFTSKINYRDHRKIVVIDGEKGFTGGLNLDDRYLNNGKHELFWRDTHLMLEGEAVKSLQFLFLVNWMFVCKEIFKATEKYFPKIELRENKYVQINASGPDWELASIMDSFFLGINSAKNNIRIVTPYFIPNDSILQAILMAARSGIDVEIMLPMKSDSWIVQSASMSLLESLLKSNIKVYFYTKGFVHSKVLTVDNYFSSVGTANMDMRSFDLNYEVNTYMYNSELANELNQQFEEDKKECIEIGLEDWQKRTLGKKLLESVARLLAPIL